MAGLDRELRVKNNKMKYYFIILISIVGALAIFDFLQKHNSYSSHSGFVVLFFFYLVFHYLIILPFAVWRLFTSKPLLLINAEGIYCRKNSTLPKKLLKWDTFKSFRLGKKFDQNYIEFELKNQSTFFIQFPRYEVAIASGFEEVVLPVGIYPDRMGIDKSELIRHLSLWLPQGEPEKIKP